MTVPVPRATNTWLLISLAFTLSSSATAGLVTNGSFEDTTGLTLANTGVMVAQSNLPGWLVAGGPSAFDCVVTDPAPQTNNCTGRLDVEPPSQWGFWTTPGVSPDGGNFFYADGDAQFGEPISQLITGLVVNQHYTLTFHQAAAQENGFSGATQEWWRVTFAGTTQDSAVMNTPSHGHAAWNLQTMEFVANATSSTLTFLAMGTPSGQPPLVLLDGVDLAPTPEPATFGIIGFAIAGLAAAKRRSTR
ncbi:MAG: PEP-CTERM sorting domain-containing protein [Acidobacteria bacterium]|nr:PEP-CTERM sorting domain-containing protein [Acidobacteriota bacterium]